MADVFQVIVGVLFLDTFKGIVMSSGIYSYVLFLITGFAFIGFAAKYAFGSMKGLVIWLSIAAFFAIVFIYSLL